MKIWTFALLAIPLFLGGCASDSDYKPSTTKYKQGQANVAQPKISQVPNRSFDGIRVAGYQTDLDTGYWDSLLQKSEDEKGNARLVFDTFRARYHDLQVYGAQQKAGFIGADEAALNEFKIWVKQNNLEKEFNDYWPQ